MHVLIIDDCLQFLEIAASAVESAGHTALTARTFSQANRYLGKSHVDVVFLEIHPDKADGLSYLETLKKRGFTGPVVACTDNATISDAVESMSRDAFTFLQKPIVPAQIRELLDNIEQSQFSESSPVRLRKRDKSVRNKEFLMETNELQMQQVLDVVEKAARTDASILLLGPSGTGKTVLAKYIHSISHRSEKPFVTVSCPSLSKELFNSELFGYTKGAFTGAIKDTNGKVHAAEGGTLFFDEIGEMPLEIQPKLLRLLQERKYERLGDTKTREANIRLIAATNRDMREEVAQKRFREDLLFRINVINVCVPPLKERQKDLPFLIDWFFDLYRQKHNRLGLTMDQNVRQMLLNHQWPGNLRELGNVIERCVILAENGTIGADDLPKVIGDCDNQAIKIGNHVSLSKVEEAHIIKIIEASKSLEEASNTLGIDKATLYRKRKKLGLN